MTSDRRIFLDETRKIAVEADDPRASFLLVGAGCQVDQADADSRGLKLVDGKIVLPPEPKPVDLGVARSLASKRAVKVAPNA